MAGAGVLTRGNFILDALLRRRWFAQAAPRRAIFAAAALLVAPFCVWPQVHVARTQLIAPSPSYPPHAPVDIALTVARSHEVATIAGLSPDAVTVRPILAGILEIEATDRDPATALTKVTAWSTATRARIDTLRTSQIADIRLSVLEAPHMDMRTTVHRSPAALLALILASALLAEIYVRRPPSRGLRDG